MIPKLLILDEFLSYRHAEVNYGGEHLVALAGENGAGKSALAVDALTWALWGESRARSDDDLVRQGSDWCRVEVHVEARGWEYVIARKRTLPVGGRAGHSSLTFVRQGDLAQDEEPVVLTAETIRETQEKIDRALGLDYSTFINTACLIQGRADEFTRAAPGDRKKVLASLLGLERWQEWTAAIHDEVRAVEGKADRLDALVVQGKESLAPAPALRAELDALGPALDRLLAESNSARTVAEEARRLQGDFEIVKTDRARVLSDLRQRQQQRERISAAIERIDGQAALAPQPEQVADAVAALARARKGAEGLEYMEAEGTAFTRASDDMDATKRQLQIDIQALTRAVEALGKLPFEEEIGALEECPTCGQTLHDAAAEDKARATVRLQRANAQALVDQAQEAVDRGMARQGDLGNRIADMPAAKADFMGALTATRAHARALPTAAAKVAALEEAVKGAQGLQDARHAQVIELAEADSALAELDAAWAALEAKWKEMGDYGAHVAQTEEAAQTVLKTLENARAERDRLQGRIEQLALIEIALRDTEKEALRLTGELEAGRTLERAFGPRGVQALLIDSAIPEIMDEANRLLNLMTGGSTTIEMTTQRTGKTTGKEIETLDVVIADAQGVRPYENYSGGERFRIDFGLRIALSRLLARRANAPCRTLIMDEGFGSQDGNGRNGLVEALATVSDQFGLVLVISHVDDIKELFPATVIVRKGSNGSEVSLV